MRQLRLHSEKEILREIERARTRSEKELDKARELEQQSTRESYPAIRNGLVNEAFSLRRHANSLVNVRVPKLKRALAAFRTKTFPFMDDDSVVLK